MYEVTEAMNVCTLRQRPPCPVRHGIKLDHLRAGALSLVLSDELAAMNLGPYVDRQNEFFTLQRQLSIYLQAPDLEVDEIDELMRLTQDLVSVSRDDRESFDMLFTVSHAAWSVHKRPRGDGGQREHFDAEFDDVLIGAGLQLLRARPIRDPGLLVDQLKALQKTQEERWHFKAALRTVQFLTEVAQMQTAQWAVPRALGATPLPAEIVSMVVDAAGGCARDLITRWSTPRPKYPGLCPNNHPPGPDNSDVRKRVVIASRGCEQKTCPARTWTEWRSSEYRWVCIHTSKGDGKTVECPQADCQGHHDQDFNEEDWKVGGARDPTNVI